MKDRASSRHEKGRDTEVVAATVGVEELFRAHARFAASLVHRLGVPERDVPDVVQEVFLVAHRKGGFVPGVAQPRTWIGAIAVRLAAQYRRKKRETIDADLADKTGALGGTPIDVLETRRSMEHVQRCLAPLDEEHRDVFLLYEVGGESCKDIAAALDVPIGTVYSRLHYARKRFADEHASLTEKPSEPERGAP